MSSSLKERLDLLEADLTAQPPRISSYSDLPFAILRYAPAEEWELRRQVNLLATRLGAAGKMTHQISLAELLWKAIEDSEGLDAVVKVEKERGFGGDHDPVLSRQPDRHDGAPFYGPEGPGGAGQLPGEDLWIAPHAGGYTILS